MSTARVNITDRAQRYRAQKLLPVDGEHCLLCGSTRFLVSDHWDGHPDHTNPGNLEVLCKSCNTAKGAAFAKTGRGRLTNQFNPTKGGGAANVGEWMNAVGAITPHVDRGDRGLVSTMSTRDAVDMIRATSQSKRRDFAAKMRRRSNPWPFSRLDARRTTPASGGIAYHTAKMGKRPPAKAKAPKSVGASKLPDEAALQAGFKRGLSLREILAQNPSLRELKKSNPAKFDRCVKAVQKKGGDVNAYAVCKSALKGKRNPAAASAEAFEEFHGFAPSEVITVTKKIHHHAHLAAAGKLTHLEVWGVDGKGHKISGFSGALLAFNEQKNQLFVEGGDQSINLDDFGIRQAHELETLGQLTDIGYHTRKDHLGSEGGEAVYVHKFRSTNQNGKHVVVKIARYPDLIYDVRNEQLLFSGGSYEILREGINK